MNASNDAWSSRVACCLSHYSPTFFFVHLAIYPCLPTPRFQTYLLPFQPIYLLPHLAKLTNKQINRRTFSFSQSTAQSTAQSIIQQCKPHPSQSTTQPLQNPASAHQSLPPCLPNIGIQQATLNHPPLLSPSTFKSQKSKIKKKR